jgi:anaerobic selenocysteine-containing dehydrogenase
VRGDLRARDRAGRRRPRRRRPRRRRRRVQPRLPLPQGRDHRRARGRPRPAHHAPHPPRRQLVEATWDEAYAEVARRLQPILQTHGPDAVAIYLGNPNVHNLSGQLYARPLIKALRTTNVYSASSVDQLPKHVSSGYLFGDPLAIPVPDVDRTDLLVVLGGNPRVSNGSLWTAPDLPAGSPRCASAVAGSS